MNPYYGYRITIGFLELNLTLSMPANSFMHAPEGASDNVIMVRNPFYPATETTNLCANQSVYITNPVNGSTLFWVIPSVNENVTVTLNGFTSPQCYYRINDGDWNTFTHCSIGENATYEDVVTMPEGYPVTVTVNIIDSCGTAENQTAFNVVFFHRGGINKGILLILAVFALMVLFIKRRRRR